MIVAQPYDYDFPAGKLALIVIDMQRDFIEQGGFGSVLGNDVRPLGAIVPTVRRLIEGFRAAGLPVIHTREGHRPDLADCPPAKRARRRQAHHRRPGPDGPHPDRWRARQRSGARARGIAR
jgi:biuret amidohydrolase